MVLKVPKTAGVPTIFDLFILATHKDELVMADQAVKQGFQRDGAYWRKGQTTLLPVWESKITNAYDLHYGSFGNNYTVYPLRDANKDPEKQFFRYWEFSESFFDSVIEKYDYRKRWLLAYRDVARSTDERSVIALGILYRACLY